MRVRACVCVGPSVLGFSKSVDSLHQPPKRGKNVEGLHHLPLAKEHPEIASAFANFEHHVNAWKAPLSLRGPSRPRRVI